jgi:GntR family transcriptional regulator/MocR family aminotransferase
VTEEDVVVTNGTQQALDILARVLLSPGDQIVTEDPSYAPPRLLFQSLGLDVVGVRVDREGLDVLAMPEGPRVVYTTPSHQYPLGVALSLSRRLALLDWAERNNAAIIEDDYDSEFRFGGRPLEPLRSLDRYGRVVYVGSFSKTMLPTLRLGFMKLPPSLRAAAQRAKFMTDWHSPLPAQRALAEFIRGGGFARHVRRMNRVYQARHEIVAATLEREFADHLEVMPSNAGLHIGTLARDASRDAMKRVMRRASEAGVEIHGMARLGVHEPARAGLILGYGGIGKADLAEGLRLLRHSFED